MLINLLYIKALLCKHHVIHLNNHCVPLNENCTYFVFFLGSELCLLKVQNHIITKLNIDAC